MFRFFFTTNTSLPLQEVLYVYTVLLYGISYDDKSSGII